jgi:hypothetical protein
MKHLALDFLYPGRHSSRSKRTDKACATKRQQFCYHHERMIQRSGDTDLEYERLCISAMQLDIPFIVCLA